MVTLPLNATDDAILATLNVWLAHLARDEYQQAFDFTYHPAGDDSTPDRLREQIAFYGDQFNEVVRLPVVTDAKPEHCVVRPNPKSRPAQRPSGGRLLGSYESLVTALNEADPNVLGEASLQLPFGGKWSDVFATFAMINRDGRLGFALKSIYIH
jgi:hypothetical protein